MKKWISLLIALVMMLSLMPAVSAEDGAQGELVSLLGFGIGGDTQGPLTGWIGDLWAKKGLQLEAIAASDAKERMQTMLASGDLPDLVRFTNWVDFSIAIDAGYLVNLDEHLDMLPHTVANVPDALQYVRDFRSNDTGLLYGIPDYVGPVNLAVDAGCYAFNVRWDIYAQAGYPEAETLEDMIDVFKKMKEVYPKNEEGLETYALNTFAEWDGGNRFSFANAVLTTLGYYEGGQTYFIDYHIPTGEVNSIFEDDSAFLRAVKFLYNLNKAGLVDPDSLTQTYVTSQSKIASGQYMGAWWGGYQSAFDTMEKKNSDPPVGFEPVMFGEYAASTMGNYYVGTNWPLTISANTSNLEACLTYVDANADQEFVYELTRGPKGLFWDMDADGKTFATENYYKWVDDGKFVLESGEEFKSFNGRYTFYSTFMTAWGDIDPTYEQQQKAYTQDNKLLQAWSEHYGGEYKYPIEKIIAEDRLALRPLAFVSFMPALDDDMQMIRDAIGAIVQQNCWKMVYAADENEFNALWEQTKADAAALGVEQVQEWMLEQMDIAFASAAKYE